MATSMHVEIVSPEKVLFSGEATQVITRTLGGPLGWNTPFYVQNAGTVATDVESSFYAFDTGALIACHRNAAVAAGKSIQEDPNAASEAS